MSTDIKVSASTGDAGGCSSQDVQCRKLTEVCMRQAARLEQMHDDLDKAKQSEQDARKELERSRQTLEQERAEFGDKVEQMAAFQAALQRENDLLLEELISVLGRTKALRAEMVWLQRFLPAADRSTLTSKPLQNGTWQGRAACYLRRCVEAGKFLSRSICSSTPCIGSDLAAILLSLYKLSRTYLKLGGTVQLADFASERKLGSCLSAFSLEQTLYTGKDLEIGQVFAEDRHQLPAFMPHVLGSTVDLVPGSVRGCLANMVRCRKTFINTPSAWHDDVIAIEEAESDASFCATYRRFVDAAEHLEQAICVRQQLLGDDHEELLVSIEKYVVSCNSWGVQCLSTGNYIAALELFKKAEAMTEADNVPNFKRRVVLRAVTFNNLCCYYRTRGKLNAALQFAEKALKIEEKYKEADSPARSYLNYGVLLSNSGRHGEALERVERAVAVLLDQHRHEKAEATQKPEPTEISQLLVVAHYNMFVEHLHLKQFASSLQCLQRAVSVAQNKLGTSHTLTTKMQEVHVEAQARLERKASAECFRTTAAAVESSPVFFHYQDGHCHPWQKVHLAQADAARAQEILADQKQITLRRLRPPDPRPPEKPRIRSRRSRLPAIGAEVTGRFWESHPKLLDTEGYAGSPILTQQAHGAQPMVEVLALKQLAGTSPRGGRGGAEREVSPADDAKAATQPLLGPGRPQIVPAPPGAPPEVVASWEYHHRRLQMLDEGNGLTALEPHRMRAITVLRDRLDKRREKGLPAPTDYRKHQAATCIQAGIRGYLVRQWTSQDRAAHHPV
ncbi:unnamed protein product [Symbiodinium sp. CCMP2456]|nr:unnamed protein product [Symbiodinium sp. CCMP2456]